MVAILGYSRAQILEAVRQMYTEVALAPGAGFHFPTGRDACRLVGYPEAQLDAVPATAVESFAGVGWPFRAGVIRPGHRVLDVGAGSGTDTLIAAALVGPTGHAVGLDMTEAMLAKLRRNIALSGFDNVEAVEGDAETIPLPDSAVDVVTSNGVLNLVPDKARAFAEIFRVLRPGGHAQIADIVVGRPVGETSRANPTLWAECIVGAMVEEDCLDLFRAAGFVQIEVLHRFDYFTASPSETTRKVAARLGAHSIEIRTRRPA